ncbi:MAG: LLM class flavin-dependent oxidoreductase [Gammaproteobacteria bacterium]|nr:LLM class flavin-dependent oxidoreductase [Gammaproteobacteria bacterium]MDE0365517.1 LLM class flavin-dependent oxidoreductase [Gammaproteobacteria bacterium]
MGEIGVTLDTHTEFLAGSQVLSIVRHIEELGFESVWLTDTMGREPFVLASALLSATGRIRVGTGIASMYGRDALAARQTRQTLSELFPGRFLMGLGVSAPFANEGRKAHLMSPAGKVSSFLDDMRSFQILSAEPETMAPVYVAAHGPKLQGLALEKADGILTWVMPAEHIELTRTRIGNDLDVSCQVPFMLDADADQARRCAREYLAVWLQLPWYCRSWRAAGFSDADLSGGGSDAFIDAVVAWGDAGTIADRVARYFDAGASRVILEPLRKTREGEARDVFHQADVTADWPALDVLAERLLG